MLAAERLVQASPWLHLHRCMPEVGEAMKIETRGLPPDPLLEWHAILGGGSPSLEWHAIQGRGVVKELERPDWSQTIRLERCNASATNIIKTRARKKSEKKGDRARAPRLNLDTSNPETSNPDTSYLDTLCSFTPRHPRCGR